MVNRLSHYLSRAEIYFMGFRRTTIPGVTTALQRRGLEGVITYSKDNVIMLLNKDRTLCFPKYPMPIKHWMMQNFDFVDYVYQQLDEWNWE